jgi:hypothetical protein
MAEVRAAVRQVPAARESYPAIAVDGHWNLVDANAGLTLFVEGVAAELPAPPVNAPRVSLHPAGMAPRILNLGEWRAHLLGRLRRQAVLTADPELDRLYEELRGYSRGHAEPDIEVPGPSDVFLPLRLRHDGGELSFFSTVSAFGTPLDITVAELAGEPFFPADQHTANVLRNGGG